MTISRKRALESRYFHVDGCKKIIGPRGGVRYANISRFRKSGMVKRWKTRPKDFTFPVKYGMYGPSGIVQYIHGTMKNPMTDIQHFWTGFHREEDCPTGVGY